MSKSASSLTWRLPQRVAYVVNHSYPYSSDGYAVRTHEVARALTQLGHEMLVINRPGRPWDIEGFDANTSVRTEQMIDGVRYIFLPSPIEAGGNRRARLRQTERVLFETFEVFRPGAVMAVSNWENAEPAQNAARRCGSPFFYEQRGFWEMSRAACEPEYEASDNYQLDRQNEVRVAKAARAVFTLNGAMRDELVRRGVARGKIHLVPNGVAEPAAVPRGITRASLGCSSKYLLGYVGSLSDYEGSGDLLQLMSILRDGGVDVDLMIVGSSAPKGLIGSQHETPTKTRLRAGAKALQLADHVHFVPQVAQQQIGAYYSMVDAIVMPRRRTPVTELVAPLKPYAAAAYGVPVFMTDMPPLDEVARDIYGSLFPEGDIPALAAMVREALEQGDHPAVMNVVKTRLLWPRRVQPMSRLLRAAAAEQPVLSKLLGAHPSGSGAGSASVQGQFDTHILPGVALRAQTDLGPVAALGPCVDLAAETKVIHLTRINILTELATADVGRFVIDWAGLQERAGIDSGEWDGLWSTDNMRLNRQVMDACRIALDRGWRLQVRGPVQRAQAPLFRTVSGVLEEILPEPQVILQEAAQ